MRRPTDVLDMVYHLVVLGQGVMFGMLSLHIIYLIEVFFIFPWS